MELAVVLEKRMNAIQEAKTDREVFKHIHAYIKYVLTTPKLENILETERKDFYKKVQFTDDNIKLEHSNFYQAYFVSSYVRIYLPMEDYWNTNDPDEKQDPVALLLIWGMDHSRTKKWIDGHEFFSKRDRMQTLKSYWRWFDGQVQDYVTEIKNLHLELLTKLSEEDSEVKQIETKQEQAGNRLIEFDIETGDFHFGDVTDSFNIKTQPYRVLRALYLADGKTVPYLGLVKCLRQNAKEVTKTNKKQLTDVIKNLKKTLGISDGSNPDIFRNEKMVGYSLDNTA